MVFKKYARFSNFKPVPLELELAANSIFGEIMAIILSCIVHLDI